VGSSVMSNHFETLALLAQGNISESACMLYQSTI